MKKTISIHLANHLFVIEEDAYELLHTYLEDIKKRIGGESDIEEIMFDIESGIAEKFSEYKDPHAEAISKAQIEQVMKDMGDASVFDGGERKEEDVKKESGFGKRFYRDEDNTIVAGVCSGIAAYLGIDPLIIRLIFVFGTIAWGTGIFVYLVLAIVMPQAKTPAQKMEMRGDEFTLQNIERFAKEKTEDVKRSVTKTKFRKVIEAPIRLLGAIVSFLKRLIPILGSIIGFCLMAFAFVSAIFLTIAGISLGIQGHEIFILPHMSLLSAFFGWGLYGILGALYIVCIIPLICFWFIGSLCMRRKRAWNGKVFGLLLGVWFLGIVGAGVIGATTVPHIYTEQKQYDGAVKEIPVEEFSKIESDGAISMTVKKGDAVSAKLQGNENDFSCVETVVQDGVLRVKNNCEPSACILCNGNRMKIEITAKNIEAITTKGDSRISVLGTLGENVTLNAEQTSRIYVAESNVKLIRAESKDLSVIDIEGSALYTELYAKNYGRISYEKFEHVKKIQAEALDDSRIELDGDGNEAIFVAKNSGDIYAENVRVEKGTIETKNDARVRVYEKDVYTITEQKTGSVTEKEKQEIHVYEGDGTVRVITE